MTFNLSAKYFSKAEKADGENDVRFWDAMLNADRRDYERICSEYGVEDLRLVLKKLEEKKKERRQNMPMVWKLEAFYQYTFSSDKSLM